MAEEIKAQSSSQVSVSNQSVEKEKKYFECFSCGLHEEYHYYGKNPPFCRGITFLEPCYIMKNPFSKIDNMNFLLLGSDCINCHKSVCQDCSIFFTVRFCRNCYQAYNHLLPEELRQLFKKQQKDKDLEK